MPHNSQTKKDKHTNQAREIERLEAKVKRLEQEIERLQVLEKVIDDTLPLGEITVRYGGDLEQEIECDLTVYDEDGYEFYYSSKGKEVADAITNAVNSIEWMREN